MWLMHVHESPENPANISAKYEAQFFVKCDITICLITIHFFERTLLSRAEMENKF